MMMRWVPALFMLLAACTPTTHAGFPSRISIEEVPLPPMKTFTATPTARAVAMSNLDLAQDFLDLSFALESGSALPVFTRFEGPIKVRLTGTAPASLRGDLSLLVLRLQREAGIDIDQTTDDTAQITIEAVSRSAIKRVLPQAACFVAPNVSSLREFRQNRRSTKTNWLALETRSRIAIFVPNDVSPQEARDCLHEELAQALGPLNDLYRLPNSVFNDDNVHAVLTSFDMLMLRITYAPELESGMTREEVAAQLPALLARLNPGSERPVKSPPSPTPRAWLKAIQTALGPDTDLWDRRVAADETVRIAKAQGWSDHRRGFSHYARARILQSTDPEKARAEYQTADRFFAGSSQTRLHRAYVATQLAAYALAAGDSAETLRLTSPYIDVAQNAQNAALLSTLQLLQAEAYNIAGEAQRAQRIRLDSLGWARYGFGPDRAVLFKLDEIAALGEQAPPA
ncbi:MAG: DUF2927 domain-containing protein [Roseobacter sp.]